VKKLVSFVLTLILSFLLAPIGPLDGRSTPIINPDQNIAGTTLASDHSGPGCQPAALIILNSSNFTDMQQTIELIIAEGGCAAHVFPPSALIGRLESEPAARLIANGKVHSYFRDEVNESAQILLDGNTRLAALVWNQYLEEPEHESNPGTETPGRPLTGDVRKVELPFEPVMPEVANGPGYYDTSKFLYGKVAVGIIIPESNGSADPSTENWSDSRMEQVVSEIAATMNWYQSTFPEANLSFYYDIHRQVPTKYEPITRPSSDDTLWIQDTFANMGVPGSWTSQTYSYLNQIRSTYQTDWAIVTFVADSLNDPDGLFTDGYFGYTYGFLIVMTYDNDGWGISRMDSVMAHEMAHDFGAADEYCQPGYSCCWGGGGYGYLNIPNSNCEAACDQNHNNICDGNDSNANSNCHNCPTCIQTSCIMRSGGVSSGMDTVSRWQIGVRDSDGDGLYDPVDTKPALTLSVYSPNPTTDNTPTYSGSASDIPYDPPNQSGISINYIKNVRVRVDGGVWQDCIASDGIFNQTTENFSCTPAPLTDGTHELQIQATNRVDNTSSTWSDNLTVDATAPSNPTSANPGCAALDNTWQNTCNDPNFSWSGASDPGSGVAGYYYYWGVDPNGSSTNFTTNPAFDPSPISGTNIHYLRIRVRDNGGNISAWTTLFRFKYDSVAPENPTIVSSTDHPLSTWSTDNTIAMSWSGALDPNGSGIAGYSILWSTSPTSLPDTTIDTVDTITTSLPLADGNSWYFHLRTRDQVNLWTNKALHLGPFYIDTAPPVSTIDNVTVHPCGLSFKVDWSGNDSISGVASFDLQYRIDASGVWTDWLESTPKVSSTFGPSSPVIPVIGTPIYLRVRARDKAGNIEAYTPATGDAWFTPQSSCLNFLPLAAK
jgi:hypothetical protein